jgi:glutamine---fructose-6-phosphate transaminase (isomerizing)
MLGEWMEKEIWEQPAVLVRGSRAYYKQLVSPLSFRQYDMVLLVARGSSDNAALVARYWIEIYTGIPVSLAAPSVITQYQSQMRYRNCLAIGISQSGAAPDVAEVLSSMRADGHTTVAITNTPGSRITKEADHVLMLDAGPERSVAATKTYTASLLALYQLTRCLCDILPSPEEHLPREDWLNRAKRGAELGSGVVVRNNPIFSLGRGYSFGTAQECALKLMECALVPAKSYSTADFEHGPKALAGCGTAAISFDGPQPELAQQQCTILETPKLDVEVLPQLKPIWDAIYAQFLALHVARARGLNPDDPRHLSKITETY